MELILRDLETQSLKAHLEMCRNYCRSLAKQFALAQPSLEQTNLAFTWDAALKHGYMVHFLLDLLERREKEGRPPDGTQHIRLKAPRHRPSASSRHVVYAGETTSVLAPGISSSSSNSCAAAFTASHP